jgi:thiamine-phosphate pyrophosphorylase
MCLYVLITSSLCRKHPLDVAKDVLDAGADCLQLREKEMASREYAELAAGMAQMCRDAGRLFIVNDRPDIALSAGAGGVHLGQEDMSVAQARRVLSGEMVVGVSTHNSAQARQAVADGADYIGVGTVFATQTKPTTELAGTDYVRQVAAEIDLPHVAIGGITADNVAEVIEAGARCVAVCSAIISSEDASRATGEFVRILDEQSAQ